MGKVGHLVNNAGQESVWEFGDRCDDTSVYTTFVHMLDALMGSMSKVTVIVFIIEIVDNYHDTWLKKALWTISVWLILIDDVDIDSVKVISMVVFTSVGTAEVLAKL